MSDAGNTSACVFGGLPRSARSVSATLCNQRVVHHLAAVCCFLLTAPH